MSGTVCPGYNDTKPPKLRWLAPGRVKSRDCKLKRIPSDDLESKHNEMTIRSTAKLSSEPNDMVIPRFETMTETCALFQAAVYCKWRLQETP